MKGNLSAASDLIGSIFAAELGNRRRGFRACRHEWVRQDGENFDTPRVKLVCIRCGKKKTIKRIALTAFAAAPSHDAEADAANGNGKEEG